MTIPRWLPTATLVFLCPLVSVSGAMAQQDPPEPDEPDDVGLLVRRDEGPVRVRLLGGYRAAIHGHDSFPIDVNGTMYAPAVAPGDLPPAQMMLLEHRLRVHPRLTIRDVFAFGIELDLLSGVLGGYLPDSAVAYDERLLWTASGLQYAEVRQVYVHVRPANTLLQLGLMTDHWGLGAVANDGGPAGAGFADDPFGTDYFGDRLFRVAMQIGPRMPGGVLGQMRLQLMLDLVAWDEDWQLIDRKDAAFGPGLRLSYDTALARWGAWLSYRTIQTADGLGASTVLGDLFVDRELPLGRPGDGSVRLSAEVIGRVGRTDLLDGWPATGRRQIIAGGALGEVAVGLAAVDLTFAVKAGLTSGDGDPGDAVETDLSFDRDLNAGVVLFDEVLAGLSARRANQWAAMSGIDATRLADEGAIHGAAFVQPYVAYRPHPVVVIRLGGLIAGATADPLLVETPEGNVDGGAVIHGARGYGGEIDASVALDIALAPQGCSEARIGVRLEYGHLFPGPALTDGWTDPVPEVDVLAFRMGLTF